MSERIKAAAGAVAEARDNAAKARDALAEAQAGRQRLHDRVAAIAAERGAIVAARRAGNADPEHGVRLEILRADEVDVAGMVVDADADVKRALDTAQAANGAVTRAEQYLIGAQDEVLLGKLVEHATTLDGLLLKTVTEIAAIGAHRRSGPAWFPSDALASTLTKLNYTAGLRR
jgi:hypothetical protein